MNLYSVGQHVLVLPEQAPYVDLREATYATIRSITGDVLRAVTKTRRGGRAVVLEIPTTMRTRPAVVTHDEFNGAPIGSYLRKSVCFSAGGTYVYAQVTDYQVVTNLLFVVGAEATGWTHREGVATCGLQYAVDFTCYETNDAPPAHVELGNSISDDPAFRQQRRREEAQLPDDPVEALLPRLISPPRNPRSPRNAPAPPPPDAVLTHAARADAARLFAELGRDMGALEDEGPMPIAAAATGNDALDHLAGLHGGVRDRGFATAPAIMTALHHWDFAPGRLSIAHLQNMDPREYGAWCVAKKIDVSNNGSTAKMPEAAPFADMAGLRDACSNVGRLAADLGSPVLRAFAARLASFMRELPNSGVYGKAQVTVFSTWIDDACRQLHDELRARMCGAQRAINVISVTHTPLLRFNQQLSELVMESRILPTNNKRQGSDATGTQAKKAKAGAAAEVKHPWFEHVPTHDGKKICLKNLTKRGCASNAAGECFNSNNVHHVTAIKLHPHVLQHLEHMGGLNELHNALK
ncbi:hypothetical protein SPRG_12869 [Saprolegnia parasitica CBS 223.65]|uniref:Uncharacterized protein n=1 Tax=Saprolegnia parasitica (strain CBS 223.65) TaxID=695850 RepID=A0A067BSY9_SAPPC|nr:hypothetical protein SPRG_12869 [Saprolegnia parasitica CBS 223.65]KDO21629.1 hypothetical protein SPRG_12869 [Saprolegnia parasitica CBS 223.65]|eukprot:XP_012207641.1 hypothetical protein SPRG_12869 [Saprolegnia parasitica CBS 223.65]